MFSHLLLAGMLDVCYVSATLKVKLVFGDNMQNFIENFLVLFLYFLEFSARI